MLSSYPFAAVGGLCMLYVFQVMEKNLLLTMVIMLEEIQSKPVVCAQFFLWNILDLLRYGLSLDFVHPFCVFVVHFRSYSNARAPAAFCQMFYFTNILYMFLPHCQWCLRIMMKVSWGVCQIVWSKARYLDNYL